MYKNILVTVDGTAPSNNALEQAAALANLCDARLILAHVLFRDAPVATFSEIAGDNGFRDEIEDELGDVEVVPTMPPSAAAPVVVIGEDLLEKFASLLLEKAAARAKAHGVDEPVKRRLDDEPVTAILACAEAERADLIVTGSRGFGEIKSLVLGSVSHKLVEGAECPCLIVK